MRMCQGWGKKKCPKPASHRVIHYMGGKVLGYVCKDHNRIARRWWDTEPMRRAGNPKGGQP